VTDEAYLWIKQIFLVDTRYLEWRHCDSIWYFARCLKVWQAIWRRSKWAALRMSYQTIIWVYPSLTNLETTKYLSLYQVTLSKAILRCRPVFPSFGMRIGPQASPNWEPRDDISQPSQPRLFR